MRNDYREGSFAAKNKPRRQPVGMYAAVIAVVMLSVFVAGFAGGWFACSYKIKKTAAANPPVATSAAPATGSGQGAQVPPASKEGSSPPLTFYQTLPKGEKGVIGSGINANLQDHPTTPPVPTPAPKLQQLEPAAKPAPPPPPSKPATPAGSVKQNQPGPTAKPPVPAVSEKPAGSQPSGEKKFTVQVTSVKNKSEAESMRDRLAAKGYNPMVIGVNVADKGVVYRVRVGRHMLQSDAQDLAAKIGSGAIVTPE